MDDETKADIENLRTEYREVCQNHRAITDFRGKLLTLLPLASGAGIYLLIPKQGNPADLAPIYLIAIGVFGALVTFGLFLHELRGIEECGDLITLGRLLEEKLGLRDGQFIRVDNYYHKRTGLRGAVNNFKGPIGAAWIIYPSVCAAWLFVAVLGYIPRAPAPPPASVYPGATWEKADARASGWSTQKLDEAQRYLQTLATGSVVVVEHGRVVAEWGDPAKRVKLSSVRKSLLSALYGIHVRAGRLDLDKTLAQLGIDDSPTLMPAEKMATLRMLLQSRSGVYHPYVGGAPSDRAAMPARGSHQPGSFWYYNNWDFNVLGTVFEQQLHAKIAAEFRDRIAEPVQMQDFRLEDMHYVGGTSKTATIEQSIHPAYHFRMTARDMARFGYLFLRHGNWNGRQVVPQDWVTESTTSYSDTGSGGGYGYLWWVNGWPGVSVASYSARGALGKYIVVVPARDLVVVYQNHTEFPDDAAAMPASEIEKLPSVSAAQMGKLLALILDAQPTAPNRRP